MEIDPVLRQMLDARKNNPNPVRRPDILARVKVLVEADPKAATASVIIALIKNEFHITVNRNQIAGAFLREGIKRGGYSRVTGEGVGHNREETKAKAAVEKLALDRTVIAEQKRVVKASILATPRTLTVAPRERPTRAIRAPEVTLVAVRYEASARPVALRYGRVIECVQPLCGGKSEPSKPYCLSCCKTFYVGYRPKPERPDIDADVAD